MDEPTTETLRFYTDVLGFCIDSYFEEWAWALVSKNDVSLMLSLPNAHDYFGKPAFTGSFYCNTDNVDALWEQHLFRMIYAGLNHFSLLLPAFFMD